MILYARETSGKKNATLPDATYQYKGKEVLSSSTWVRDLSDSMVLKNGSIKHFLILLFFLSFFLFAPLFNEKIIKHFKLLGQTKPIQYLLQMKE